MSTEFSAGSCFLEAKMTILFVKDNLDHKQLPVQRLELLQNGTRRRQVLGAHQLGRFERHGKEVEPVRRTGQDFHSNQLAQDSQSNQQEAGALVSSPSCNVKGSWSFATF